MKRFSILLSLLCLLSCGGNYQSYYLCYDAVEAHEEPSAQSAVSFRVTTFKQPKGFKKDPSVPHAFNYQSGRPVPVGIRKVDPTGKWGYVKESLPLVYKYEGWVPLDQMLYCGNGSDLEKSAAYVVVADKTPVYKHPKANQEDAFAYSVHKGDTLRAWTVQKGWVHMSAQAGNQNSTLYGWVPVGQLKAIDSLSVVGMRTARLEKREARKQAASEAKAAATQELQAQQEERHQEVLAQQEDVKELFKQVDQKENVSWLRKFWFKKEVMQNMLISDPVGAFQLYKKACGLGIQLALLCMLIFLLPAFWREKTLTVLLGLPACILGLWLVYTLPSASWAFGVAAVISVPLLCYVVLFPVLYLPTAIVWRLLFLLLSWPLGSVVFSVVMNAHQVPLLLNILLSVVLGVLFMYATYVVSRRIKRCICPRCGYYAASGAGWVVTDAIDSIRNRWFTVTYKKDSSGRKVETARTFDGTEYSTTRIGHVAGHCGRCGHNYSSLRASFSSSRYLVTISEAVEWLDDILDNLHNDVWQEAEDWIQDNVAFLSFRK